MNSEKNKKLDTNQNPSSDKIMVPDELVQAYKYKKEQKQNNRILFSTFSVSIILFLAVSVFIFVPKISKDKIANSTTIRQEQVVAGQQIKHITLIEKSEIKNGKYIAKLPENAKDIKVISVSKERANKILSSKLKGMLSLSQRQQLAVAPLKNPNNNQSFTASLSPAFKYISSFFVNIYKYLSADLSEAVENATQAITNSPEEREIVQTLEATYVDISQEAPSQLEETSMTAEEDPVVSEEAPEVSEEIPPAEALSEQNIDEQEAQALASASTLEENLAEESIVPEASLEVPAEVLTEESITTPEVADTPEDFVAIEYTAQVVDIVSELTDSGQQVTVSAPNETPEAPLVDVIASTKIPELFKVGQKNKIQIEWENPDCGAIEDPRQATACRDKGDVAFNAYDADNNGKLDYVEWTVPHLSTQVFNIIFISQAFHLDEQQNILADIYGTVRYQDGNYVTITNNQYVRVTFDGILDNTKDNTIHAKATNPSNPAKVEVYPVYTDENGNVTHGPLVATFENISEAKTQKVLLTNLQTPTDLFDLKVLGSVDFDYIVDPVYTSGLVSVELVASGSGYYSPGDIISVPGGNNDGSIYVVTTDGSAPSTGDLYDAYICEQGSGYFLGDTLIIYGGENNGEIQITEVSIYGAISGAHIISSGSGYTVGDEVVINGGDNNARLLITGVNAGGGVTSISVENIGSNYESEYDYGTTGGSGSGFEVYLNTNPGGEVWGYSIIDGGSGYQEYSRNEDSGSFALCIDDLESDAGYIESIDINSPGTGYAEGEVEVDGDGLMINITAVDALKEIGYGCSSGSECISGYCDTYNSVCSSGEIGAGCSSGSECISGYCDTKDYICSNGEIGDGCGAHDECASAFCSSRGLCSDMSEGSDCEIHDDCESGLRCAFGMDDNKSCQVAAENGAECSSSDICASGYCTINSYCSDRSEGSVCGYYGDCASDFCTSNGYCSDMSEGSVCGIGDDCASDFCTSNGYCSDMSEGSVCAIDDDCEFGLQCIEGVCAEPLHQSTPVTSITVSGAESATTVVNGSTLQMSVSVLPVDATDQTVTWSKTNGTGTATINSSTGLLTATGVGTVTVRATANDGSAIYGELEITVTTLNVSVTGGGYYAPPLVVDTIQNTSQSIFKYVSQALDAISKSVSLLGLNFIAPNQPTTAPNNLQPNTPPSNQAPTTEENRSAVIKIYEKIINTLISIISIYISGQSTQ